MTNFLDMYHRKCECFLLRLLLLVFHVGLTASDCYTDFRVWRTVKDEGFQHPFHQFPPIWVTAWLVFSILGTITAFLVVLNEISLLLNYCDSDRDCSPCAGWGCNYVTRGEALTFINIALEDFPLLTLTLIFHASRYSCDDPTPSESSQILKAVLHSSVVSTVAIGWTFLRGMFRILIRCCTDEEDEKDDELDANELYPRNLCYCLAVHVPCTLLCHLVTLGLSIATVALAAILLSNGTGTMDPSKDLGVCLNNPNGQDHCLTNARAVLERGNKGLCYNITIDQDVECTLFLRYDSDDHQLEFNFAPISGSGSMQGSETDCATDYDVFLGYSTSEEEVKRFVETCLAALLTCTPENKANVEWNRALQIPC